MKPAAAFDKIDLKRIRVWHAVVTGRSVWCAAWRLSGSPPEVTCDLQPLPRTHGGVRGGRPKAGASIWCAADFCRFTPSRLVRTLLVLDAGQSCARYGGTLLVRTSPCSTDFGCTPATSCGTA